MSEGQFVFTCGNIRQSEPAVDACHLVIWVVEHKNPPPHRDMVQAGYAQRLLQPPCCFKLLQMPASLTGQVDIEGGMTVRAHHVVEGFVAVLEFHGVAGLY